MTFNPEYKDLAQLLTQVMEIRPQPMLSFNFHSNPGGISHLGVQFGLSHLPLPLVVNGRLHFLFHFRGIRCGGSMSWCQS